MQKTIMLMVFVCASHLYGMEKENKWTVTAYGTKINLYKDDNMLDYYADGTNKVDFIVVGQCAQEGKFPSSGCDYLIGTCLEVSTIYFVTRNQHNNYKKLSYRMENDVEIGTSWYFPLQQGSNVCIRISEPYLWGHGKESCNYNSRRFDDSEEIAIFGHYAGNEAIEEALKDVRTCYKKALTYIAQKNDNKLKKTVALPALGVEKYHFNALPKDQAAPVAITAIFEYIKNNPKAYERIKLFVEEGFEFDLYKELLIKEKDEEQNILHLYFAQNDPQSMFALLPRELIDYIAKLI
jgi:hypothetical protein